MRAAFASEIEVIAENNDKVVLLSGDIGNRIKRLPEGIDGLGFPL